MTFFIMSEIGLTIFFVSTLFLGYKLFQFYTFYFTTLINPLQAYKRRDATSWALITGSSAGIGYALAHRLLSLDFGVIILAHEGIHDAETRLRKDYPSANIKAITFSCTTASMTDISKLVAKVADLNVTMLVNNVGSIPMSYPPLRPFANFDADGIDDTIALNARFMTHLTRLMIPTLKANANPRSLLLNVTSQGRIGMPYISVYSATKAYNASLSASLSREFALFDIPIDCLAIVPGNVFTDGNCHGMPSNSVTAADFAEQIVKRADAAVKRHMVEFYPCWKHWFEDVAGALVPEAIIRKESAKIIKAKVEGLEKAR